MAAFYGIMKRMSGWMQSLDHAVKKHLFLVALFFLVIVLRLPNFFEPYWYGDEGIYLAIGQSLAFGRLLYAEIIDHKTPLIYYLAMTPTQLGFRVLLLGWSLAFTGAFYHLSRVLFKRSLAWMLACVLFVIFTTLPWMEGNIPNGELFVMGFVLVAAALLSNTSYVTALLDRPRAKNKLQPITMLAAGVLLGLGILTKVPALFDWAAIMAVAWLVLSRHIFSDWRRGLKNLPWQTIIQAALIGLGTVLPIVFSVVYFVLRGSGQAYLDFGLLYNFRYAGSWGLPFDSPLLLFLFTLPGKTLVMGGLIVILTALQRWLRPATQFSAIWLVLAFFAALLSNRPYPHYFLQVVPPAALLMGAWLETCLSRQRLQILVTSITTTLLAFLLIAVGLLLQFYVYPTVSYYQNWLKLVTGQMSVEDYRQSFNRVMADNYAATEIITTHPDPYLFIWGTNPMLYAQTKKIPTGRFTVAFHIKDFDAYDETLAAVEEHRPAYIVVMNNDAESFPAFTEFLDDNYRLHTTFDHFTLWRRLELGYN